MSQHFSQRRPWWSKVKQSRAGQGWHNQRRSSSKLSLKVRYKKSQLHKRDSFQRGDEILRAFFFLLLLLLLSGPRIVFSERSPMIPHLFYCLFPHTGCPVHKIKRKHLISNQRLTLDFFASNFVTANFTIKLRPVYSHQHQHQKQNPWPVVGAGGCLSVCLGHVVWNEERKFCHNLCTLVYIRTYRT